MQKRVLSYFLGGAILAALVLAIIGTADGQSIGGMIDNVARALARSAVQTNHTGSATINGSLTLNNALTVGGNITGDGTANILPNQTAASGASVMTKTLVEQRERFYLLTGAVLTGAAGQRDFPGGGQNYGIRFANLNDAAGYTIPPPRFAATNLVVLYTLYTTNSVSSTFRTRWRGVGSDGSRLAEDSANGAYTTGAGTNVVTVTNTIATAGSPLNNYIEALHTSSGNGNTWLLYVEGFWQ